MNENTIELYSDIDTLENEQEYFNEQDYIEAIEHELEYELLK